MTHRTPLRLAALSFAAAWMLSGCPSLDFKVVGDGAVAADSAHDSSDETVPPDATSNDAASDTSDATMGPCQPPYLLLGTVSSGAATQVWLLETQTFKVCQKLSAGGRLHVPFRLGMTISPPSVALVDSGGTGQFIDPTKDHLDTQGTVSSTGELPKSVFAMRNTNSDTLELGIAVHSVVDETLNKITSFDSAGAATVYAQNQVAQQAIAVTADPRAPANLLAVDRGGLGVYGYSPAERSKTGELFRYPDSYTDDFTPEHWIHAARLYGDGPLRVVVAVAHGYGIDRLFYLHDEAKDSLSGHVTCPECSRLRHAFIDTRDDAHLFIACSEGEDEQMQVFRQKLDALNECTPVISQDKLGDSMVVAVSISDQ